MGLWFYAHFGYTAKSTIRSLEDYANWFLEDHVSRARLACRLRVYMRSTASYRTLLIILTVWGPYVALSVLMVHGPVLSKARHFWVACQAFYLAALFVMLAGSRNSTSRARWSDIHIASMFSLSCCAAMTSMLCYDLLSRDDTRLMQWTSFFLLVAVILLRVGFAFFSPNRLFFHRGLAPFQRVFIEFERDMEYRLLR
jgi:hypothetical protein